MKSCWWSLSQRKPDLSHSRVARAFDMQAQQRASRVAAAVARAKPKQTAGQTDRQSVITHFDRDCDSATRWPADLFISGKNSWAQNLAF